MKKILYIIPLLTINTANALELTGNNYAIKFNTSLMGGGMGYKTDGENITARGLYNASFKLNGEYKFNSFTIGSTFSELLSSNKDYSSKNQYGLLDAFIYFQNEMGRIEIGRNDSIACKLHVFSPEVSGLRMHKESLIYKYLLFNENTLTTTSASSLDSLNRITIATRNINNFQFGIGYTPGGKINNTEERELGNSFDFGLKYKNDSNKIKTTTSFGFAYLDKPIGEFEDIYAGEIKADYRLEFSSGINLSYNSFTFGTSGRYVYDKDNINNIDNKYIISTGLSYDLLKWSTSIGYYYSHNSVDITKTLIYSNRYKFNQTFDIWLSLGQVYSNKDSNFLASGIGIKF